MIMDSVQVQLGDRTVTIKDMGSRTFSFHDSYGFMDMGNLQTAFELANKQLMIEKKKHESHTK